MDKVTKQDFLEFEEIRLSGKVNMYMLPALGFDKEVIKAIMDNYDQLKVMFAEDLEKLESNFNSNNNE